MLFNELATNSTITPASVDPNLVYGTWALVVVTAIAVIIAALQNRRTQRIMAEQIKMSFRQLDESVAQTKLQQRQFDSFLKQQSRDRVKELIQIILSPAISILDSNTLRGIEYELGLRTALTAFLTDKNAKFYDQRSYLVFRDFEVEYKDLAQKMKRYDHEVIESIRLRWIELHDALLRTVIENLPAIKEKYKVSILTIESMKARFDDVAPTLIVDQGILPALQQRPENIAIPEARQLWELARSDFLGLTKSEDIVARINNLKAASGKCANVSESLSEDLSTLRDSLGTEYGLPRDQYFVPPTPTVYLEED